MRTTLALRGAETARTLFTRTPRSALAHGYLFSGPAGIGKKTFARRLAQSLLCHKATALDLDACNRCAGCRIFAAGSHPDFTEHVGEMKIGTAGENNSDSGTARGIIAQLALRPYHGAVRIAMLGDVSFATREAANAMLTFFEDPPASVIVILTTSTPGELLPTIRSRLVNVPFAPLSTEDIAAVLVAEGIETARAQAVANEAQGSMHIAHTLLEAHARSILQIAMDWLANVMHGKNVPVVLDDYGTTPAERRTWLGAFLDALQIVARDYAVMQIAGHTAPRLAATLVTAIDALPAREPYAACTVLEAVNRARQIAQSNVTPTLILEHLRVAVTSRQSRIYEADDR